jgi:hypothetical protein
LANNSRALGLVPRRKNIYLPCQFRQLDIGDPLFQRKVKSKGNTPMKFMILVKADKNSEAGLLPDEKLLSEMGKYNEELAKAGVMLAGEGLHPTSKGARIRFSGGRHTVTNGPFPESGDLIAGFWLWQVKSKEEAIEWVKRAPFGEGSELEVRQVHEAEDFGEAFTPELREQGERVAAQMAENARL